MALECLTALCFPSAAEPKAEVTCLSPEAAAERAGAMPCAGAEC